MVSGKLWRCFLGGNITALGSGTLYLYSFYAPQLIERCQLPLEKISLLPFALTIGSSFFGLLAGIIIDRNPALACRIASVSTFSAYLILYLCYHHGISAILPPSIALLLLGFGSVTGFYAAVKCCTANFPEWRGTITAVPISLLALAGMFFSQLCNTLFGSNMESTFLFLAVTCSSMILVGGCTLYVDPMASLSHKFHTQDITNEPDINDIPIEATSEPSSLDVPLDSQLSENDKNDEFAQSNSLQSELPRTLNRTCAPLLKTDKLMSQPYLIYNDPAAAALTRDETKTSNAQNNCRNMNGHSAKIFQHMRRMATNKTFLLFYLILSILQGIGQMYIYSVGFIVSVLFNSNTTVEINHSVEKVQATQVTVISLFSFCGRLSSGPISDLLLKKYQIQRLWNIVASSLITFATCYLLTGWSLTKSEFDFSIGVITLCSAFCGYSYGVLFGTFPSIIAETFGIKEYSTNWGLVTTGGLWSVKLFAGFLEGELSSKADPNTGICSQGISCLESTFRLTALWTACTIGVTLFMINSLSRRRHHRRIQAA